MEEFCRYVMSVISAALVVGILTDLSGKNGSISAVIRLIGGLFLAFAIASPVAKLDFSNVDRFFEEFSLEGEYHAGTGEAEADNAYRSIIKSEAEAYILDKADAMQAQIQAEVTLSDGDVPIPVSVRLSGDVSPYAKAQLEAMLEEELGISKENQKWIG